MPVPPLIGTATLDSSVLVDALVPDVIDGLRDALQPALGVRAYRTYRIVRTWSGVEPGDGTFADVAGELRPYPRVLVWDGFRFEQAPAGVIKSGRVRLTEVSLTYSQSDLAPALSGNQELFYAIGDANGQGSSVSLFANVQPPYIDREKDMGWVLNLIAVQTASPWVPS